MQSWLHRHRSTTHHPRHLPAPFLQPAQRPWMASRLIARCNLGSFSLFTECRHRRPNRRRHNCSPCTARRMKLSSTTHGPVTNLAFISSNHPQPPLWHRWLSGPIARPGSTESGDAAPSGAATHAERRRTHSRGDGSFVGYLTKLTEKALSHLIVTARLLCG